MEDRESVESGERFESNTQESRYRVFSASPVGNWTRWHLRVVLASWLMYLWSSLVWQDKDERESDHEDAGTTDEAIVVVVFVGVIVTAIAISAHVASAGVVCAYLTCLAHCFVLSFAKGNVETGFGLGVKQWSPAKVQEQPTVS